MTEILKTESGELTQEVKMRIKGDLSNIESSLDRLIDSLDKMTYELGYILNAITKIKNESLKT